MIVYVLNDDNTLCLQYQCPPDIMEEGKFLLPSVRFVDKAPPVVGTNKVAVYQDGKWVTKDDYRGVTYWVNGVASTITTIGEKPPADSTSEPPIILPVIQVSPWQLRQALNELGLRNQVEDLVSTTTNRDIKDGWEFATFWREDHPLLHEVGARLGLTTNQIHAIFVLAAEKNG